MDNQVYTTGSDVSGKTPTVNSPLKNFWDKIRSRHRLFGSLALLLVVAAVPLTVFVAQQNQDNRQRASENIAPSVQGVTFDPPTPRVNDDIVIELNGVTNADNLDLFPAKLYICSLTNISNYNDCSTSASEPVSSSYANPRLYPNTNRPHTAPSGKTYSGWFSRWLNPQHPQLRTPGCHTAVLLSKDGTTRLWTGQLCFADASGAVPMPPTPTPTTQATNPTPGFNIQNIIFDPPSPSMHDPVIISLQGMDSIYTQVDAYYCQDDTCTQKKGFLTFTPNTSAGTPISPNNYVSWSNIWMPNPVSRPPTAGCYSMMFFARNATTGVPGVRIGNSPKICFSDTPGKEGITNIIFNPAGPIIGQSVDIELNRVIANSQITIRACGGDIYPCQSPVNKNQSQLIGTLPLGNVSGLTWGGPYHIAINDEYLRHSRCYTIMFYGNNDTNLIRQEQLCYRTPTPTPTNIPTSTPTPTPIPTATSTPVPNSIKGDINGDGKVDLLDFNAWKDAFLH